MSPAEATAVLGAYVVLAHNQFPAVEERPKTPHETRVKQNLFALLVGILILYAALRGYRLSLAEGYDDDFQGHMAHSLHYERLAQDLNLFAPDGADGKYVENGDHPAWVDLGQFWEGLHPLCRWGGRFGSVDSNHISLAHNGRK